MKVKMYPITKRPSFLNGTSDTFVAICAYCVQYDYCKHPKEELRKLYLTEHEYSSINWEKFVKFNYIKSWCYYEDLIFE